MDESRKIKIRKIKKEEAMEVPSSSYSMEETYEEVSREGVEVRATSTSVIAEKIGRLALFGLVLLIPLFFLPLTVAPLEVHKQILGSVLLLVALVAYLINVVQKRVLPYPKSWMSYGVLAILVSVLISAITSVSRGVSIFGSFIDSTTLVAFLIYGFAYFLASAFLKREDLPLLAWLFFGSAAVLTVLGLLQIFGNFILPWSFAKQRAFNTVGSISSLAIFLAAVFSMIAVAPLREMKLRTVILLGILGLLALFGLVIINYRFLWFTIAFFMILVAAFRFVNSRPIGFVLSMAIVALFFALIGPQLPVFSQLPSEVRPSLSASFSIAKDAFTWKRMFFGWGPGTFGYAYNLFKPNSINYTPFWNVRFAEGYNFLTTSLTTFGLIGVLAFLFLIGLAVKQALKLFKNDYTGMIATGVLFLILQWFFYPVFFTQLFLIFFGLGYLVSVLGKTKEISFENLSRAPSFAIFFVVILFVALSLSGIYIMGQKYYGAVRFARGAEALSTGDVAKSLQNLDFAVRYDATRDEYMRVASQAILSQVRNLVAQPDADKLQSSIQSGIGSAVQVARQATVLNPKESLNWANLGNVYESLIGIVQGAENAAEESYRKAMDLDPQNPDLHIQLARAFASIPGNSGVDRAKSELEAAIALKSDYAPSHFLLAQLYIREGNVNRAIQKVEEIKSTNPFDPGLAFQLGLLYYQNNQFQKAQEEFERAVGLSSNYSNARYFLGLIYDRNGNQTAALEQFKKIEEFNPDNQEVKTIIANLEAGKSALSGIVPPAQAPEDRSEVPVPEKKEQ